MDRKRLGYGDERWASGTSAKAFRRLLEDLGKTCDAYVHGPLFEALTSDIKSVLGTTEESEAARGWRLERKVNGPDDGSTLWFTYPRMTVTQRIGSYVAPNVLLEFGARAEHWPAEERHVGPYAAQAFPELFTVGAFPVWTLNVTRTFWEKATILHSLACGGAEKVRPRMARHYYDLALLAGSPEAAHVIGQVDLLEAVATHKERFFPSSWASYKTARPGSLRLVPPPDVQKKVEADYRAMEGLFMEEPPPFARLVELLAELEQSINR